MNSSIMSEILNYYKTDNNYISINDDRIGRIVSFKLYINDDNEILADFYEARKIYPNNIKNYKMHRLQMHIKQKQNENKKNRMKYRYLFLENTLLV